jgi:hypothetical protein
MLSSTSSSEATVVRAKITRVTWVLLLCAALVCAGAEAAARFGLERISKIHQRIMGEQRAAAALRKAAPGQPATILFAGNSLLLVGFDTKAFESEVHGLYKPQRLIVEATNYYDWYYGLRRLFHRGMRPDVVVVSLHAAQLTANSIRGDFSAGFLFDIGDLWPMSRDTGADMTQTSSFYAAHVSTFYAARSELRSVLMGKLAPAVTTLWQHAIFSQANLPADEKLVPVAVKRLKALDDLCRQYGAEFVFLIPTTYGRGDTLIVNAGKQAGVRVIRALPNDSLTPDYYEADKFHLNEKGALVWTQAAAKELLRQRPAR